MARRTVPPRIARALLQRMLGDRAREFVVGDLDEEFTERQLRERGPLRARIWYWRQALASIRSFSESAPSLPSPRSESTPMLDSLAQDVRFALRSWQRTPAPMLLALLALALGIGANTAIFSVVHGVLLEPLPYPADDELMTVWLDNRLQGWHQDVTSYPNFVDWSERSETFESMAAHSTRFETLTGSGEPRRLRAKAVTWQFFDVLGVEPAIGRSFTRGDFDADERLVVLSHGTWVRDFGSDPQVLGRQLVLDGDPSTVVGVMPAGFYFVNEDVEYWRLFGQALTESSRGQLWLEVVGRLADGVSVEQARAEMDGVGRWLEQEYPDFYSGYGVNIVPLREELVGDVRPALLVLLGAVGVVLLIACGNVANLMLTRALARRREIAVRAALGASGGRIARQTLTESVLLAGTGGLFGVAVALMGLRLLRNLDPDLPRLATVGVDATVLGFTLAVSVATGLIFGLVPAAHARAADLADALKERSGVGGGARARSALVVAEISLALVLLVGAGLLVRSYDSLLSVSPGFDAEGVLRMRVALSGDRYQSGDDARAFFTPLLERLHTMPGVDSAAGIWHTPLAGGYSSGFLTVEGQPPVAREDRREVKFNRVTPGAFATLGVPVRDGRPLQPSDNVDAERVLVVNESFARQYFPEGGAVGGRILFGDPADYATEEDPNPELPWMRVVGVVGDLKQRSLARPTDPEVFIAFEQSPSGQLDLLLRSEGDPLAIVDAVRREVWAVDPELPVANVELLSEVLRRDTAGQRFNLTLVLLFAVLALVLATIGIYGIVSHWVRQQTREIGVRMALGAERSDVLRLVMGQTLTVTGIGVLVGLLAAAATSRLMASLLFGVGALDPLTFGAVTLLAVGVAALTAWFPARRATGIDPVLALRDD